VGGAGGAEVRSREEEEEDRREFDQRWKRSGGGRILLQGHTLPLWRDGSRDRGGVLF
jgi:hypothetical protein